jgi:hypothetical protein
MTKSLRIKFTWKGIYIVKKREKVQKSQIIWMGLILWYATLLCFLSESWDHLVTSISFSTTEALKFDTIVGSLLSKEVWRKSSLDTSTPDALVVRARSTERGEDSSSTSRDKSTSRKGKQKFWHCNKVRHVKKDCWKL